MTSIVGGPSPVAQVTVSPDQSRGDEARLEARAASVAASADKAVQAPSRRQTVDGVHNPVSAKEASAHYDAQGRATHTESRYKEHRDHQVDIKV